MKKITAFIKPFKLYDVRKALESINVQGMSVTESRGYGRQKGQSETYRGEEYDIAFLTKLKIEIATTNELCDKIVETIMKSARTGQIGDGKILVSDLDNVYRIRTGENGIDAVAEFL
ncbi:MAG: P-II family nitrogen regulator [Candidatus Pelagibacterales bacterium]|jgi:nitrogen regulatory protein P-II 2|nr:P-II family nitrogen regulator [Pelagibacteraceae bacterium]MDC3144532.1 P-II family nitrogen regulator [Pelagibacteraceae bacterium]|tara:strand:- start:493 stop:843 length:351 start_codon:yes stop_codon:yes gene_type:complete